MGTVDEGLRQGMAGGVGGTTVPEHAGQVPDVREHHPQEQHHNTLRHSQGTAQEETGHDSPVPQGNHRKELSKDQDS